MSPNREEKFLRRDCRLFFLFLLKLWPFLLLAEWRKQADSEMVCKEGSSAAILDFAACQEYSEDFFASPRRP